MSMDYAVGYAKPPEHGQFKPGRTGNPRGRPKGTKNLKTDLLEEFNEKITIKEGNGRTVKISKQRALIKRQMQRGLTNSPAAANKLFELYIKVVGIGEAADAADVPLSEDERRVLEEVEARILRRGGVKPGTDTGGES